MQMKKLLMLGTSYESCEMIKYAKSKGIYTIVTDPREPEESVAKLVADEYWMINVSDIDLLEKKCIDENINAVVCGVSEYCLEVAMELCSRLKLPNYCTPQAWHYSCDKADFKELCRNVGAPIPEDYDLSSDFSEYDLKNIKYPVVVKPVDMSANRGISYCYTQDELVKAYKYARSLSKNPKIIVERMLKGKEWYGYYAIADGEIRQICLNAMEAEPGQLKNIYSITTNITDGVERFNSEINPLIIKVLEKVGCKQGIAWVQVMLDEDDHFYIIEMGYRLPGDLPDRTYPRLCNFDALKWLVDYALGYKHTVDELPPAQEHSYKQCACGYSLWTHKSGYIKEFVGFDDVVKISGVEFYTIHNVGEHFDKHTTLGVITVFAEDCDEFCRKIDLINRTISILDGDGEDVLIRYTNFEYLKDIYTRSIARYNK